MKNISVKLSVIFVCVSVFNVNYCLAQNLKETVELSDSLFNHGDFVNAIPLYHRALFFDKEGSYNKGIIGNLAQSYAELGSLEEASEYYFLHYQLTRDQNSLFSRAVILLSQQKTNEAKSALYQISNSSQLYTQKQILIGLTYVIDGDIKSAEKYFKKIEGLTNQTQGEMKQLLNSLTKSEDKSRTKALVFSGILPGSGQFYSKHYEEGINSFLIVGAVSVIYVNMLLRYGVLDALLGALPWFQRYYVGGMNAAADLVDDYKLKNRRKVYNQLIEVLSYQLDQ